MKPRLLDLFSGAGGCARGYQRAGFYVVGVDINPQPRYAGDEFVQADALTYPLEGFDAIHASPPCQAYSRTHKLRKNEHPDLVGVVRDRLLATGLPYVIENVPGSPLRDPVVLEGQMFEGLRTQRARWFETNWGLEVPFMRSPRPAPNAKMGRKPKDGEWVHVVGNFNGMSAHGEAMGIDWMNRTELAQAIPPTYTELVGEQLMREVIARRALAAKLAV